jgi:hypothetical protein
VKAALREAARRSCKNLLPPGLSAFGCQSRHAVRPVVVFK